MVPQRAKIAFVRISHADDYPEPDVPGGCLPAHHRAARNPQRDKGRGTTLASVPSSGAATTAWVMTRSDIQLKSMAHHHYGTVPSLYRCPFPDFTFQSATPQGRPEESSERSRAAEGDRTNIGSSDAINPATAPLRRGLANLATNAAHMYVVVTVCHLAYLAATASHQLPPARRHVTGLVPSTPA